ncbi:MAG TPA: polyprenyl synthetase family protein [Candidatus Lumbricidophila sp.]|nr:polyprenyl synthetase family protein [Candidatus Lumbricidophila sp.]
MSSGPRLVDLVDARIATFLDARAVAFGAVAPDLAQWVTLSERFLRGGKRFRALFCYWGWDAASGSGFDPFAADERTNPIDAIVGVAAALEIFHAAALVHDDLIDNSDSRRGQPSAHRQLEAAHRNAAWTGDPASYGRAAALLYGDLLLGWSDELLDEATENEPLQRARAVRREYVTMRNEVTAGQFLDVLEESAWVARSPAAQRQQAERVMLYKSAKYSVEAPLVIGALLGGATDAQVAGLRAYGRPLGLAYQLRDDLLGVFGDPAVTGKPSGDDLRAGKRTVLIALAHQTLPLGPRQLLDELLGDANLTDSQIAMLQHTLIECGAVEEVESLIAAHLSEATSALQDAPISARAQAELLRLAAVVADRTH